MLTTRRATAVTMGVAFGVALLLSPLLASPASAGHRAQTHGVAVERVQGPRIGWHDDAMSSRMSEQAALIRPRQRASGAITHGSGGVNPYFGNFAALGLLAEGSPASNVAAGRWFDWVHAHLNTSPAVDGGRYTIYDYALVGGAEVARDSYDSVDSYAATTLSLAAELWRVGDDATKATVVERLSDLEKVAQLLDYAPAGVRKASGLTQATFAYNVAYLMDNAEVYAGLSDFAALQGGLGRAEQAATYASWAETGRAAILRAQWKEAKSLWSWHDSVTPELPGSFYAQGMAQYFPVLCGVVSARDTRAIASWHALTARWPDWRANALSRAEAATPMAYAAVLMGDADGARAMLDDTADQYSPGWLYPTSSGGTLTTWWSPSQAGWYIRTLRLLETDASSTGR